MEIRTSNLLPIVAGILLAFGSVLPARAFYDPGVQRWITRDPVGESGGLNPFRFVRNQPVGLADPYGECPLANPYNAEAYAPGSTFLSGHGDVTLEEYLTLTGLAITFDVLATTAFGIVVDALGPVVLSALGLTVAETPQGQQAIANSTADVQGLLMDLRSLEQGLWEERYLVDSARNAIAYNKNIGVQPNPYGLLQDLKAAEEGVAAKEKAIQLIREELRRLGCQTP